MPSNDKISLMTAATAGNLVGTTTRFEVSTLFTTVPVTLGVTPALLRTVMFAGGPGYTATGMTEAAVTPALFNYMQTSFDRVPQRRLLTTDEVAATFAFLASGDASGITGANIVVDGGLTANWYILETLPPS